MKCFMPVYALALALAVTSNMFDQVSGAACDAATVCLTESTCTEVADGKTTVASLERPAVAVLAACPTGKFAYIKSLVVVPDSGATATTTAPAASTAAPTSSSPAPAPSPSSSSPAPAPSPSSSSPAPAPSPSSSSPAPAAGSGSGASPARRLAAAAVATLATDIKVTFTKDGTASSLTSAAATPVTTGTPAPCDNTYADIGKDATGNVKASIGCASTAANCKFKYKVEWACQENATTTTAPTPTPTSGAVVAGASPAVTLGVALVAAVAGANFAGAL